MSVPYSSEFSKDVIRKFLETVPRGWQFLQKEFPRLNFSRVVMIFQCSPTRWNNFKKSAKLADRLCGSPYYADKHALIRQNLLAHKGYYADQTEAYRVALNRC